MFDEVLGSFFDFGDQDRNWLEIFHRYLVHVGDNELTFLDLLERNTGGRIGLNIDSETD